ncbi:MAG: hypothetical protein IKQ57_08295 [Candidatus Methanomethylophilaceae archaeon]|nr:hypothetical protein [Candidatus Methanomethylophilaceae archaeon]
MVEDNRCHRMAGIRIPFQVGIEYQESRVEPAGFEERTGGDRLAVAASASFQQRLQWLLPVVCVLVVFV